MSLPREGHVNMLKMIVDHHKPPVDLDNKDVSFEDRLISLKSSKDEVTKKLNFLWKNKTKVYVCELRMRYTGWRCSGECGELVLFNVCLQLGWRPLHLAIQSGHLDVVELLLQVHTR